MDTAELQATGLYDPAAPHAADRLALLRWLAEQGFTLDEMVDAAARGRLTELAADRVIRPGTRFTIGELAARSGIPVERIETIRRAVGFAPVGPDAPVFVDSDVVLFQVFEAGASLFSQRLTLQFSRVMGSALARIAETAVSMFLTDIEAPLKAKEEGELALAQATLAATEVLGTVPAAMDGLFRIQVEETIRRSQAARQRSASLETGHLAVGFVDLVGFTSLSQRLAWNELAAVMDEFEARANDLVAGHDGRVVKLIGDEVMFVALDAAAGCRIALDLFESLHDSESQVTPRGGLAVGDVLTRAGDYYGRIVNVASRVAELAVPDEVLVTREVVDEAVGVGDLAFEPAGRRMLKGFDEPVELWAVRRSHPRA